jgi:hypothetical protein
MDHSRCLKRRGSSLRPQAKRLFNSGSSIIFRAKQQPEEAVKSRAKVVDKQRCWLGTTQDQLNPRIRKGHTCQDNCEQDMFAQTETDAVSSRVAWSGPRKGAAKALSATDKL